MYSLDELLHALRIKFPDMIVVVDRNASGNGWIDLPNDHSIEVLKDQGFGLHTSLTDIGFGEKPNEVYHDVDSILQRVEQLQA